jgi:hypothetical protein
LRVACHVASANGLNESLSIAHYVDWCRIDRSFLHTCCLLIGPFGIVIFFRVFRAWYIFIFNFYLDYPLAIQDVGKNEAIARQNGI